MHERTDPGTIAATAAALINRVDSKMDGLRAEIKEMRDDLHAMSREFARANVDQLARRIESIEERVRSLEQQLLSLAQLRDLIASMQADVTKVAEGLEQQAGWRQYVIGIAAGATFIGGLVGSGIGIIIALAGLTGG